MAICSHLAPNQEKSILYQQLEQEFGVDKAHDYWDAVRSQQFLNKHGDWMKQPGKVPVDINGEPTADYVKQKLGIKALFIAKNAEQAQAVEGIQKFIQSGDPDKFVTLQGKAGTGKTHLVQEAIAPAIEEGKKVIVAALAHKAKLVLSDKLDERFGKGTVQGYSIAGALAMGMDNETGKFSPEFGMKEPPAGDADVIIVDEGSMVNEDALAHIMSIKKRSAKVIFLGDIGQLPPIREKTGDPNAGKSSPVFNTTNKFTLSERVRQGEESPILPYADKYWNNSQSGTLTGNPVQDSDKQDIISDKGALVFAKNSSEILPHILPQFKEAVESGNPDKIRIIVYKNDTRKILNDKIRNYIFGEQEAKKQFVHGDLIMFQDNYKIGKDTISNSTETQVKSAEPDTKNGYKIWKVSFVHDGKPVTVDVLDKSDEQKHTDEVSRMFREAKAMPKGSERNKALNAAWAEKARYAPIDYGYAITSHKSQGSTYDTAVVGESDIMGVKPTSNIEKSQSMYTAITRAKTSTIVIDGKTPTNEEHVKQAIDLAQGKPLQQSQPQTEQTQSQPTVESTKEIAKSDIISKEFGNGTKKVPIEDLQKQVDAFYQEAKNNPNQPYSIPYEFVSNRFKYTNDYNAGDMASILDRDDRPVNVQLTNSFQRYLENTSKRIVEGFKGTIPPEFINRNSNEEVLATAAELLIPKVNSTRESDGFFRPEEQKDIIDTVTSLTERALRADPGLKANAIIKIFWGLRNKGMAAKATGDIDTATTFDSIDRQRVNIAKNALQQLQSMGLHMDEPTMQRILNAIDKATPLSEQEKIDFQANNPTIDFDKVDTESGEFLESIGRIGKDWSDNSFEMDPRDTASARIKLFIGNQYEMDKGVFKGSMTGEEAKIPVEGKDIAAAMDKWKLQDPRTVQKFAESMNRKPFWYKDDESTATLAKWLSDNYTKFPKKNFLGFGKVADYNDVFKRVLGMLGNRSIDSTFQDFTGTLVSSTDPTIQSIGEQLRKADQSMQNEFMTVMMKQYQPFLMAMHSVTKDATGKDAWKLEVIQANRYNQRTTLIDHWKEQQKLSDLSIISPSGERTLDVERIKKNWIPILKKAQATNDWTMPENRQFFVDRIGRIMQASGIGLTNDMVQDLFENPSKWTKAGSVAGLFSVNKDGTPSGPLSIFIMKSAGMMAINENDTDPLERIRISQLSNPLYTENSIMQGLAKLAAKYSETSLYSSNHRNTKGKNVWDWGLNSKLSHQFRDFTQNFDQVYDKLQATDFGRSNWLLDYFKNKPEAIGDVELNYFDGMKPSWAKTGTDRQGMSDREQLLMSVAMFQNQGNGFNPNSKVSYLSLTHADKTTTPVYKNMPRLNMGDAESIPNTIVGKMDSAMFKVFKAEYDRIVNQKDTQFNNAQYMKGKGLFYVLPDFNFDNMTRLVKQGVISQSDMNKIWMGGQRQLTSVLSSDEKLPVINKVLNNFIKNLTDNTRQKWTSNGIISDTDNKFDQNYTRRLYKLNDIREEVKEGRHITDTEGTILRNKHGNILTKEQANKLVNETAVKDYAINHFLFNTAMSQTFYGDPAEAFKAKKGGTLDMDNVRSTMTEYEKRLAKDIAPRADLNWDANNKLYNKITLKDVETNESYLNEIASLKGKYNGVNSTDAQELTITQEHLDVLNAAGRIPSGIYTDMSNIIRKAKDGYYEFTNPEHLAVIMQPMKPIYAGQGDPKNSAILTDYIKSSSFPLYPPFTQGLELDGLRTLMEKNNIQRANFESAGKLGNPVNPLQVLDSSGKYQEPSTEDLQAASAQLHRDGFGIQQDNPYDEDKEKIKTLTQMNDNVTEGISHIKDFNMEGHGTMTGKEIKDLKESVRKEMIGHNLQDFRSRLNIDKNGTIDKEAVYDILQDAINKDSASQYTLNEIQSLMIRNEDGTPAISLMFNTAAPRFENSLMNIINGIAEIKMPGKSYIQASSAGVRLAGRQSTDEDLSKSDLNKIVKLGNWDGYPLKTLRMEDGIIKPAQVLVPFNFFDKNGNKLKMADFMKPGTNEIDKEKLPAELLQLIGGRIPNQGHSSMLPMEIVGFVPDNMGDIAFVPAAITKQMGADFDVDKLYTYKRPYIHDAETGTLKAVNKDTVPERNLSRMQADYFNIHQAILTHPDMISKVLNPLDKNDLKEESEKLKPDTGDYYNFYDPMTQLEDFQSGKEAKLLVGSSSWAVKFNARIQDKDLKYSDTEFTTNTDGSVSAHVIPNFIEVKDEHTGKVQRLGKLSGNGNSYYTKKDGEKLTDEVKQDAIRSIADGHIMVQSEAVDNQKFRSLDNLNLTSETYKAVQALIQLQTENGWAMNSKYWTRLLTQPAIWEFSKEMKQGNDSISTGYDANLYQTVMSKLMDKYSDSTKEESEPILFDPQTLLKVQDPQSKDFNAHQLAALQLFDKLYGIGNRMFQLEAQFNQDVNGSGPNLFNAMDKQQNLDTMTEVPIMNSRGIYEIEGNCTEIGATFDATNGTAINTVSQVLPYDALLPTFGKLKILTGRGNLSIDQQTKVLRSFNSSVYSSGGHFAINPEAERSRLIYGEQSLAKRLGEAQKSYGSSNPFLARLHTDIGATKDSPDFIEYSAISKLSKVEKQNMTTGWLHLLLNDDEKQRTLGEDLLRYTYLSGGNQDANSYVQFVPASYLAGSEFANMLKTKEDQLMAMKNGGSLEDDGFLVQFMQHNPEMAPVITSTHMGEMPEGMEYHESFRVPDKSSIGFEKFNNLVHGDGEVAPFVSFRNRGNQLLYMRNKIGDSTFYTRIDTLGNEHMDEYNGDIKGGIRSLFFENRSMAESIPGLGTISLDSLKNYKYDSVDGYGKFNDNVSHFSQIGVREGGKPEVMSVLGEVRDNKELPEYLRTVSDLLHNVFDKSLTPEEVTARQITGISPFNDVKLQWMEKTPVHVAGESTFNNEVRLNPYAPNSNAEATSTLLHELIHNRLQWMIVSSGHVEFNTKTDDVAKYLDNYASRYRKLYPEVASHVDALERVRYDAYNHLRNELGEDRFNQIKEQVDQGNHYSDTHNLLYALSSVQEMTAHIMTEHKVADYLNNIQSERGTTILSRVWDIFTNMLHALGKAMGFKVNDDSLLKEALAHVMKLTDPGSTRDLDITTAIQNGGEYKVGSEQQAMDNKNLIEQVYHMPVDLKQGILDWSLNVNQKRKVNVAGQRGKILDKLYEQLSSINDSVNRMHGEDPAEKLKLLLKQRELKDSIRDIHQNNDISMITKVGTAQLKWVDEVLKSDHPSATDLNVAIDTSRIWANLINTLYGNVKNATDINQEFAELQGKAQQRRIELMNGKARDFLSELPVNIKILPSDFQDKLKDPSGIAANTIALVRSKSSLMQGVAAVGWQAKNNMDEHIGRLMVPEMKAIEAKMKASGLAGTSMIQLDKDNDQGWGLINRYSLKWNSHMQGLRDYLHNSLEATDRSSSLTPEQRTERKNKSWNTYWDEMKKVSVFADPSKLFDIKTGAHKPGVEYDAEVKRLTDAVGTEAHAKEIIDQAHDKYNQYRETRDMIIEHFDNTTMLSDQETEGKSQDEQQDLLEQKKAEAKAKWLGYNSPLDLIGKLQTGKVINYNSEGDEYLVNAPKREGGEQFYDGNYSKIAGDPKKLEAYESYRSSLQSYIQMLPIEVQKDLDPNFLPIVPKDTAGWLTTVWGKIRNWDTTLLNKLTATDAEEAARLRPNQIPLQYLQSTLHTKEISDRSDDPVRILEAFAMMALQHKYMGGVLDTIHVAEGVLDDINNKRLSGQEDGKPLTNTITALKYFKDFMVFRKPRELQGKIDSPVYSLNIAKQTKIQNEVKDLMKEKEDLKNQMMEKMADGDYDHETEEKRIEAIDEKLTKYEKDARSIYGSKFTDMLISINQMKNVGYNPFSAVALHTFAEVALNINSRGKMDYTKSNLGEATRVMMHTMKTYYTMGRVEDEVSQKVHALMVRSGMLGNVTETEYGKSNLPEHSKSTGEKALDPYNWQRSTAYYTRGKLMVAMLKNKMVDVIDPISGQPTQISLWDALDKTGEWDKSKYGENKNWSSDNIQDEQKQWNDFRDKMRKVAIITFGNHDKNAPIMARKDWLWRLAGQFRLGWFPEGINSRFGDSYRDANLGREVKGRWKTYADLGLMNSVSILCKQTLAALPGTKIDPFDGKSNREGISLNELPTDMENMRKNFAGLAWTAGLLASVFLLRSMASAHKKDGKQESEQLLLNMLIRNEQNLLQYSSPAVFTTVSGNLLPATSVITDYWNAVLASGHYLFGDTKHERDAFNKWVTKMSKAGIPHPIFTNYNKIKTMTTKDLDNLQR